MRDILLGLAAIAVGGLFCFRGYLTMRIVIPIWGAFAGFLFGAGLVSGISGDGFLSGVLAWLVGAAVGLVFAVLAYTYYEVSVIVAMAAVGFVLGSSILVALNVDWTWAIVLVGVLAGALLAVLAVVANLPMIVLTVLTAIAGAGTLVAGCMLMTGSMNTEDLHQATVIDRIQDAPEWWVLYVIVALAGVVVQARVVESWRRSLREQWAVDGGRHLYSR